MNKYDSFNLIQIAELQNGIINQIVEMKSKYFQGEDYCTSELVDVYVDTYYKYISAISAVINQLDNKSIKTFTQDSDFEIGKNLQRATATLNNVLETKNPSVRSVISLMQHYSDAVCYQYIISGLKLNGTLPENKLHYLSNIYGDIKLSNDIYENLCESVQTKLLPNTSGSTLGND